jgi:uncharacterized coiled-coil protein SlyX
LGHGETGIEDGLPTFENASMIGVFTKAYIKEVEINSEKIKAAIAEGYIDEFRYKNFVGSLEEKINNGDIVFGSVEIVGTTENDNKIHYANGWKDKGRVPSEYSYSGFAILGIQPADNTAIVELNKKKESEENLMDEKILTQFVSDIKSAIVEVNSKNADYEAKITELNGVISETNASVEQLTAALKKAQEERDGYYTQLDASYKETEILKEEIAKAKVKEKVGELNAAISEFSDDEKAYAKEDIEAFNADPMKYEVNSVVDKILVEIGKKAKEAARISEINSKKDDVKLDDIFSDISETNSETDDVNIF